jgi:hypothetical protein
MLYHFIYFYVTIVISQQPYVYSALISRKFFNVLFIVFNTFVFRSPHLYAETDMKNVFQNKLYKI